MTDRSPRDFITQPPPRSLTRNEVRNIDQTAIDRYELPGIVLMENAGRNTVELLRSLREFAPLEHVVICVGKGNNGGDGFVIARHLQNYGVPVQLLLFCDSAELNGDAATNCRVAQHAEIPLIEHAQTLTDAELLEKLQAGSTLVDALLGTGVQGEVREPYDRIIPLMNDAGKPILAVDLPSGLDCDTGESLGVTIRATHTATFVARKAGFDHPDSKQYTGSVTVIDIGVPNQLLRETFNGGDSAQE